MFLQLTGHWIVKVRTMRKNFFIRFTVFFNIRILPKNVTTYLDISSCLPNSKVFVLFPNKYDVSVLLCDHTDNLL